MEGVLNRPANLTIDTGKHESIQRSMRLWEEVKTTGNLPSRRSYHAATSIGYNLIIYGGQDIAEGVLDDMWAINLESNLLENLQWERVEALGELPPPMCRHTMVSYDNKVFLFGGTDQYNEYNSLYILDWRSHEWTKKRFDDSDLPPPLDSHSALVHSNGTDWAMILFGGFCRGARSNDIYIMNLKTFKWEKVICTGLQPNPRSSISAIIYNGGMFVFGGAEDGNEKLSDLWRYDIERKSWSEIRPNGTLPTPRSGHCGCLLNDVLVIFGGIQEITRETNDMYSYNITANEWGCIQLETQIEDPVSANDIEEFKKQVKVRNPQRSPTLPTKGVRQNSSSGETPSPDIQHRKRKVLYDGPPSPLVGRIKGKVPHARDGHSGVVIGDKMYVFGGDRHQMPFNDLYAYELDEPTVKTPLLPPSPEKQGTSLSRESSNPSS
jgi:N-acetylneuraminic acid mutarotase